MSNTRRRIRHNPWRRPARRGWHYPASHLDNYRAALDSWEARVRADLRSSPDVAHDVLARRFCDDVASELRDRLGESTAPEYLLSAAPEDSRYGFARYCGRNP